MPEGLRLVFSTHDTAESYAQFYRQIYNEQYKFRVVGSKKKNSFDALGMKHKVLSIAKINSAKLSINRHTSFVILPMAIITVADSEHLALHYDGNVYVSARRLNEIQVHMPVG